tara:strand:+ start:139 stop:366 length:228 start_codon:yes stop_codon:yes gene_type:complete
MDLSNNKILNNKISRCEMCNKKLTLLSFTCKCNKKFCLDHQLPELHQCLFNFKNLGKDQIKTSNPIIQPNKIESF